jgi:hypothetical protein
MEILQPWPIKRENSKKIQPTLSSTKVLLKELNCGTKKQDHVTRQKSLKKGIAGFAFYNQGLFKESKASYRNH